jgi:hypothetical protein
MIVAARYPERPPKSIGGFLFAILRFHFFDLLQELLQHRPRLRASALLEPIQRLSGRGRPIKAARRAKLDLHMPISVR